MNIGSLIRGLLGDSKPGEAKSLELKEGQVVRGVVLSVSDSGNEAVVQIQGTPVRAELATPLQPGQTLNLQVEAPGEGGLPVLKPVSLGEAALVSPQNMGEALESLGLSGSKAGREIIQAMQSAGLPLSKELAAKLDTVMNAKPAAVPASEWLEAAVLSVKRGLPVTAETVKGLQQAVFGPQLHQLLANLEEQLHLWAGQEAGKEGGKDAAAANKPGSLPATATGSAAAAGAATSTATGEAAAPNAGRTGPDTASAPAAAKTAIPAAGQNMTTDETAGRVPQQAVGTGTAGSAGNVQGTGQNNSASLHQTAAQTVTGNAVVPNPGNPEVSALPAVAASESEAAPLKSSAAAVTAAVPGTESSEVSAASSKPVSPAEAAAPRNVSPGAAANGGTGSAGSVSPEGPDTLPAGAAGAGEPAAGKAAAAPAAAGGAALLAKLQGVLSELRAAQPQLNPPAAAPPLGTPAPLAGAAGQEPAPAAAAPRGETLFAAPVQPPQTGTPATPQAEPWVAGVLKLLGAEHEQQAVRGSAGTAAAAGPASGGGTNAAETLKGVLLQVIGSSEVPPAVKEAAGSLVQQLTGQQLLLNTDRTAPFAQVTLFLPLQGRDGQETASVHIQSRRGRKGELDAANCRLWFDLDMKQLGQTLVDVQVVDRIVSLKMHNDQPAVLELMEQGREDIRAAVESIGYQLLSLRTEPLPEKTLAADAAGNPVSRLAEYVPDAYKGVDYRI
ncbi:hypothetical protein GCM10010912_26950 [Paenibacillus albidus]|uniref:Uncharacterized protein n=1 Tax=Paenibacillus albidus TaxID=2041023 RepID=A0A917CAZ8_9BACL|nr:hypothetical protein [Paenibacillus albidus]GGF80456.1 hypothetical protein GCM10010912_26950 [Paenibacillus albidus]